MVLSAIDYAKQVLNATSNTDTGHLTGEVDDTEFEAGPYDGAAFFADYTTNSLYFYHPLYTPSTPAQGVVSFGDLAPLALSRLAQQISDRAPNGHPWVDAQNVIDDINIDGLVLLVIGVAVVIAAGIFSGGTALILLPDIFWVIMGGAGLAIIAGGAIELTL